MTDIAWVSSLKVLASDIAGLPTKLTNYQAACDEVAAILRRLSASRDEGRVMIERYYTRRRRRADILVNADLMAALLTINRYGCMWWEGQVWVCIICYDQLKSKPKPFTTGPHDHRLITPWGQRE